MKIYEMIFTWLIFIGSTQLPKNSHLKRNDTKGLGAYPTTLICNCAVQIPECKSLCENNNLKIPEKINKSKNKTSNSIPSDMRNKPSTKEKIILKKDRNTNKLGLERKFNSKYTNNPSKKPYFENKIQQIGNKSTSGVRPEYINKKLKDIKKGVVNRETCEFILWLKRLEQSTSETTVKNMINEVIRHVFNSKNIEKIECEAPQDLLELVKKDNLKNFDSKKMYSTIVPPKMLPIDMNNSLTNSKSNLSKNQNEQMRSTVTETVTIENNNMKNIQQQNDGLKNIPLNNNQITNIPSSINEPKNMPMNENIMKNLSSNNNIPPQFTSGINKQNNSVNNRMNNQSSNINQPQNNISGVEELPQNSINGNTKNNIQTEKIESFSTFVPNGFNKNISDKKITGTSKPGGNITTKSRPKILYQKIYYKTKITPYKIINGNQNTSSINKNDKRNSKKDSDRINENIENEPIEKVVVGISKLDSNVPNYSPDKNNLSKYNPRNNRSRRNRKRRNSTDVSKNTNFLRELEGSSNSNTELKSPIESQNSSAGIIDEKFFEEAENNEQGMVEQSSLNPTNDLSGIQNSLKEKPSKQKNKNEEKFDSRSESNSNSSNQVPTKINKNIQQSSEKENNSDESTNKKTNCKKDKQQKKSKPPSKVSRKTKNNPSSEFQTIQMPRKLQKASDDISSAGSTFYSSVSLPNSWSLQPSTLKSQDFFFPSITHSNNSSSSMKDSSKSNSSSENKASSTISSAIYDNADDKELKDKNSTRENDTKSKGYNSDINSALSKIESLINSKTQPAIEKMSSLLSKQFEEYDRKNSQKNESYISSILERKENKSDENIKKQNGVVSKILADVKEIITDIKEEKNNIGLKNIDKVLSINSIINDQESSGNQKENNAEDNKEKSIKYLIGSMNHETKGKVGYYKININKILNEQNKPEKSLSVDANKDNKDNNNKENENKENNKENENKDNKDNNNKENENKENNNKDINNNTSKPNKTGKRLKDENNTREKHDFNFSDDKNNNGNIEKINDKKYNENSKEGSDRKNEDHNEKNNEDINKNKDINTDKNIKIDKYKQENSKSKGNNLLMTQIISVNSNDFSEIKFPIEKKIKLTENADLKIKIDRNSGIIENV